MPFTWGWRPDADPPPNAPCTLHIVDDDRLTRDSLVRALGQPDRVVCSHESAEAFLTAYVAAEPQALILDLGLPGISGLELLALLGSRHELLPTLVLSANDDVHHVVTSIRSGAVDFLTKPPDIAALRAAVDRLAERASGFAAERRLLRHLRGCFDRLTPREQEVFAHMARGESAKQIANALGLRPRTAHIHRANVLSKFHAESTNDVVLIGAKLQNGQFGDVGPFLLKS